jgi:TrwC relaxase
VIVNRTLGPDGQWRTLDSRDLLAHRQTADAIYRTAYQTELTRTPGIRWGEPDRWGNRAIVGMPTELVRAFSKRHQQITAELERLEREDGKPPTGKLIQYVAHATRPPKTTTPPRPSTDAGSRKPASAASTPSGWPTRSPAARSASRWWPTWPSSAPSTSSPAPRG